MSGRVLVLAGETPLPPASGLRQRVLHLARALGRAFDVELAVLGSVPEASQEPFALTGVSAPAPRGRALAGSLRAPYQAARVRTGALAARAAAGGWSTVQAELPFVAPAAVGARAPLVLDAHNVESDVLATLARADGRALHRLRWAWEARKTARFEREVAGYAAAVCVTSDADAAGFEALGARRIVVVPNGVDCREVTYEPPPASGGLVYVGHFGYRPNALAAAELVDDVLPRVRAAAPGATLALVGRSPAPELLARAGDGVEVAADVPDVVPYLRRARALVVPLRSGSGTRLKVLEALAAGTPVVATRFGVAGLDVEDGVHVLLAESAAELARAAARVLVDDELARRLSREGRALVERRYDWPIVARPLVELHAELGAAG